MGEMSSFAMLAWRDRYLKTGCLTEEGYQEAWQDAEQLHRSGQISVGQWITLTKMANGALVVGNDAPSRAASLPTKLIQTLNRAGYVNMPA